MDLGIKKQLWLVWNGNKYVKKHPFYTVKPDGQKAIFEFFKSVKYPDGYAASISRNVKAESGKISGLKSHDCHVLLQRLIPVAIRKYFPNEVVEPIIQLCNFFQHICAKTLRVEDMKRMKNEIVYILCKLEQIFPPAFFDSMVHVMIHLPEEAILAGPVSSRWMYPIERLLGKYKTFVRNKARPEGSISEAYISYESLTFCSMYLQNVETSFNRPERNVDCGERQEKLSVFRQFARPFMGSSTVEFTNADMAIAHWFILNNCEEAGSKFPEIDAYERAYGGKNKNITNDIAKDKHNEMVAKKNDYIKELAMDYPEDTQPQDIQIPDEDAGLKILTEVLGVKPGKHIRGLGAGRVRDLKGSSLRARQLEEQLATERAERQAADERTKAADAAREEAQRSLALMMQSWEQTMQQLAQHIPEFVPPPMIIPSHTNSNQHVGEEEDDHEVGEEEDDVDE